MLVTAGMIAARIVTMIAMTTSNSIRVNAVRRVRGENRLRGGRLTAEEE